VTTIADVLEGRSRWCVVEGDCLEVLPTLGDKSVDHMITDAPYSDWTHSNQRVGCATSADGFHQTTDLGFEALTDEVRFRVAKQAFRLCPGWVLAFTDLEGIGNWMAAFDHGGLKRAQVGIWWKRGATPAFSGLKPACGAEAIVIRRGTRPMGWNGGGRHALWDFPIVTGSSGERNEHTTQKPLPLMLELVSLFTDPDELILDPFCGSGTTGVACLRLGRRFIGIEKDKRYAAIARERLEAEDRGLSLRDARQGQTSIFDVLKEG
jgi:site-specific DNA-methyltransferase (adenine-specific)